MLREDGLGGGVAVCWTRAWMKNDDFELPPDSVRGIFLNLKGCRRVLYKHQLI
jgi:hypothetical protein